MTPRRYVSSLVTLGLVASGLLLAGPVQAAEPMPRILLKGGAAQVSRTYTATPVGRAYPSSTVRKYQWYRGNKQAEPSSFAAIPGATGQRYTLRQVDHRHTVKVVVKAVRNGRVVGQASSATSNWIMHNMAPPVLHGKGLVGERITATLGPWADEWRTRLWWRRTGVNIPGQTGLSYRARPADAGKEISLLAIGDYRFPNGVYAIDRYAARMRIKWGTRAILKGASKGPGRLGITAISYAKGAKQSGVRGRLAIYDGDKLVKRTWLRGGRKVVRFNNLRPGYHQIKMVFVSNPWYAGTRTTRTFHVRG